MPHEKSRFEVKARIQEMQLPPMRDALVLGRNSPIGCIAMRKAIELISPNPYAHLEIKDDVISDVLIRRAILTRINESDLIAFVIEHVKPHMTDEEIIDLAIDVEVRVGTNLS